jgi:hypothetical protein
MEFLCSNLDMSMFCNDDGLMVTIVQTLELCGLKHNVDIMLEVRRTAICDVALRFIFNSKISCLKLG